MRLRSNIIAFLIFFILGCNSKKENTKASSKDTIELVKTIMTEPFFNYTISWLDSGKVMLNIDSLLTYKDKAFNCDSAIAVDYIGHQGEQTTSPLNNKGQWISTIQKRVKLTNYQIDSLNSIIGDKKSYFNSMQVSCYFPQLGIIYFKRGKVIGQSAICLSCARLESTAKLGSGENYSSFNRIALRRFEKICSELNFSNCNNWPD
jgi:hypothetical protein